MAAPAQIVRTAVLKYGGSSVADADKIRAVAAKVAARCRSGERLVVVVSAMGKTTNRLIDLAADVSGNSAGYKREMDMLMATGEQVSAALLAMALRDLGCDALSMNAYQIGMLTTNAYGGARIRDIDVGRIRKELDERGVVVATGFQGVAENGDLTTLGRGGSDTSAIAIAAALRCPCEIYSDVDGVYACDPRIIPEAKKLEYVTYEEMLEMASSGAKVLHSRGVEIADKQQVELYCGSTFSDERGTRIVKNLPEWLEHPVVTGVAVDADQIKVNLRGLPEDVHLYTRVFNELAARCINLDMITIVSEGGEAAVTFSVIRGDVGLVRPALEAALRGLDGWTMTVDGEVAKVSAIGVGMQAASGVAGRFFGALERARIDVLGATTSEIKIAVLVPRAQAQSAADALMTEFDRKVGE
ncbi:MULTISPECIES: aspartate kinase [unclassified Pyramidobacter]|uniref:aspartate kinase n=1 Tax=unclassified Pyramidobacter TaxID=2632171 RepID=UPI00099025CD|nr:MULTISPECIES: aspartate kinase [unclassified Pyramidobacter]OON88616.1 aspartate kinase [Pyramidobacter sp. C12-8]RKJ78697.1 aspartate kinase [Pyramidobacter sp. CG50-2]